MQNFILDNILLVMLTPLWIFLIVMCGRFLSVYVHKIIVYTLTLLSSFMGIVISLVSIINIDKPLEFAVPFVKIKDFVIPFGIYIDKLSLLIALILFSISFLVQVYSISYMKDEKKNYRFFALLNLFNFSMAFLLFSPNLFQIYIFWELVSIVSYLLIGFDYTKKEKSEASMRVLLINRIGDTALIGGIILTSYFMNSYVQNKSLVSLPIDGLDDISMLLTVYTSTPEFFIITCLFLIAAFVKSAQFPFYSWLQDAMEAKIPVSALLHSATMVVAGIYLTIRLLPIFSQNPCVMQILIFTGILTSLICSILASIETHPKKILAYSTSANLGLMFLSLGLNNIKSALIFLTAHAFIKTMLFLELPKKDNQISYPDFVIFVLGGMSLAGLLFSGMSAKEYIYDGLSNSGAFIKYLFIFTALFTAFYISRLALIILKKSDFIKKVNSVEFIPAFVLLILNILFYLYLRTNISYKLGLPYLAGIVGLIFAVILYKLDLLEKLNTTPKIIENLSNKIIPIIYEKISILCLKIEKNIFYNYKLITSFARFGINLSNDIENNVMNKSVTKTTDFAKWLSKIDSILQTRNIQTYNSYAFIIITSIITLIIITYTKIFGQMS